MAHLESFENTILKIRNSETPMTVIFFGGFLGSLNPNPLSHLQNSIIAYFIKK